jgi:hypothetical protein
LNTDLLKHRRWYLYTEKKVQLKPNEINEGSKLTVRLICLRENFNLRPVEEVGEKPS